MSQIARLAARLTGTYAVGNVSQRWLELLVLPVYTLFLEPAEFAVVGLLYLSVTLISQLVMSPLSSALNRFYHHPDYQNQRREFLGSLFVYCILKGLAIAALYWLGCRSFCQLLFGDLDYLPVARCYTAAIFLLPTASLLVHTLQMRERAKSYVAVTLGGAIVSAGVTIALLTLTHAGLVSLVCGQIAAAVFRTVVLLPGYLRSSRVCLSPSCLRAPLKFGYGLLVGGYAQSAITAGDRYVLQAQSTLMNVGLYDFGYRIGALLAFLVVDAVKRGVQPILLRHESNPALQRRMIREFANHYMVGATFCGLGLALFAREAIMLVASQDSYWPSWIIVPIIALAYVQHGLGNFLNMGLVMANRPLLISTNLIISALVNIGLNILLIPIWGIMGAALATLASYAVWNTLKATLSAMSYDVRFDWLRIAHVTSVGIGLFLLGLIPTLTLAIWLAVVLKTIVLCGYPCVLWATGYFTTRERHYILRLLSRIRPEGFLSKFRSRGAGAAAWEPRELQTQHSPIKHN